MTQSIYPKTVDFEHDYVYVKASSGAQEGAEWAMVPPNFNKLFNNPILHFEINIIL